MKRYILFLVLILAAFIGTAQTATIAVPKSSTMVQVDQAYTLTNTTNKWFKFTAEKDFPSTQQVSVHLDRVTGHTNVAVAFSGRLFSTDSWTAIGSTVNWTLSTADTTIVFDNPVYNRYREYKLSYTGTGTGTSTIYQQIFKQWLH